VISSGRFRLRTGGGDVNLNRGGVTLTTMLVRLGRDRRSKWLVRDVSESTEKENQKGVSIFTKRFESDRYDGVREEEILCIFR
jgi:hypothetical protein